MALLGEPEPFPVAEQARAVARNALVPGAQMIADLAAALSGHARRDEALARATALAGDLGLHSLLDRFLQVEPAAGGSTGTSRVRCFGDLQLALCGQDVDLSGLKPQARVVLARLALQAGRPVHRDVLLEALWPDERTEAGARKLQVLISTLRRYLEPEARAGHWTLLVRSGETDWALTRMHDFAGPFKVELVSPDKGFNAAAVTVPAAILAFPIAYYMARIASRRTRNLLVVTLDTWLLGWRPTDLDRGYLPFLHQIGVANYSSDPAFQAAKHRLIAGPLIFAGRVKQCQELCDQLAGARPPSLLEFACAGDVDLDVIALLDVERFHHRRAYLAIFVPQAFSNGVDQILTDPGERHDRSGAPARVRKILKRRIRPLGPGTATRRRSCASTSARPTRTGSGLSSASAGCG